MPTIITLECRQLIVVGLDSATATGGVAIVRGRELLGAEILHAEESHSENILPAVNNLMEKLRLKPEHIDGIAVAIGPGSFTGLRIGLAVAKGLSYSWNIPITGVSTLLAASWAYRGLPVSIVSSIDARRDHFFCAFYDPSRWTDESPAIPGDEVSTENVNHGEGMGEERLSAEDIAGRARNLIKNGRDLLLVGEGASRLFNRLFEIDPELGTGTGDDRSEGRVMLMPFGGAFGASHVGLIGRMYIEAGITDDPFYIAPNYLRRSEAERRCKPSRS